MEFEDKLGIIGTILLIFGIPLLFLEENSIWYILSIAITIMGMATMFIAVCRGFGRR